MLRTNPDWFDTEDQLIRARFQISKVACVTQIPSQSHDCRAGYYLEFSAPPPIITPARVVGIAATVPHVLLLFRSLKYSAQGIEAFGEFVGDVEVVEVEAKRALEDDCADLFRIEGLAD